MDDLIAWLRAQLDDDERMLRALDETALNGIESTAGWDVREYVERGLAEVDAKRRILERCEYELRTYIGSSSQVALAYLVLKQIALPCAGQPGYREEWRP